MTTAPCEPNTLRGVSHDPRQKTKVEAPPFLRPTPPRAPPPSAPGSGWRGRAGLAPQAGSGPGRGAAARGASRPPGLGSRRLELFSSPALAMEDEQKDGAYGRSRLWPAAAYAELKGLLGEGNVRDLKHQHCSWNPLPLPGPISLSALSPLPL